MSDEPDRWVNAVIETTVSLEVPVDATPARKSEAVVEVMDAMFDGSDVYAHAVSSGRWEDVESDPRGGTIPLAALSSVREGGDGRVTPLARIRELSIHDGEEDLQQIDLFTYSWDHGHEVLRADGVNYSGTFHPGDGCCHGNPCRYCGRAIWEEDPDAV